MLKKVIRLPEAISSIVTTAIVVIFCIVSITLTSQLFANNAGFRLGTIAALVCAGLGTIASQIGIINAKMSISKIGIFIMCASILILTILIIIAMV